MLPFLIKRRLEPATVMTDGNKYQELTPELEDQRKEQRLKDLKDMLLEVMMAKLLIQINDIEGDQNV